MSTACILLFLAATGLTAADSPSFLIESIEVRGVQAVSPEIVIAESLLRESTVYSEQQLRDAERRLRRLPFVFDVEMRLERGSAPGAYLLVLQITETKAWFFGFAADPRGAGRNETLTAGRRWFLRPNGVAHGAVTADPVTASLEVGYTMYDLLGRAAVLSLNLRQPLRDLGPRTSARGPSPELIFVLPLTQRQAVRVGYRLSFFNVRDRQGGASREAQSQSFDAAWQYRSVDDPFFPRHGSDVESGLRLFDTTSGSILIDTIWVPGQPEPRSIPVRQQGAGVDVRAHRYFDLGRQISVGGGVFGSSSRRWVDQDIPDTSVFTEGELRQLQAEALISGSFWSEEKARQRGPFRWEAAVGRSFTDLADSSPGGVRASPFYVRAGIGRRNPWGIYRLVITYTRRDWQ